jgi:quinol monooxygenase YgiN
MPLIIIGGIWTGLFTPSESAAVAVVYGLLVSLYYYKDLQWRRVPQLLLNAFMTSATVMLVIGATGAMAWLITVEQVAVQMAAWIQVVATEPWMFLLLFNVCLLLLGIFIEPLPAMLLSAPLFLPLAKHFNMDMVHIGVVMTANLAIALYTPPVGGTLFVAAKLARAGIGEITKALWPLMAATFTVVLLVTYIPSLVDLAAAPDPELVNPPMQALIVEFLIRPEHVQAFAAAIAENARLSRAPNRLSAVRHLPRPGRPEAFFLYELYDDEAAVQAHLHSAHFLAFNQATGNWVEQKTVRRYLRTAP